MSRARLRRAALLSTTALITLFGLMVPFGPAAHAAGGQTFYLDPNGNDANDGLSIATPWRTLAHAAQAMPAWRNNGNTLVLRGGVYDMSSSQFGGGYNQWSGTADSPTTFKAYPGENPVLSGNDHTSYGHPVFELYGDDYVTFDGLTFQGQTPNSAADDIYAVGMTHVTIKNCTFGNDSGGYQVVLDADHGLVTNNRFEDNLAPDLSDAGDDLALSGTNTLVTNNYFGNAGHGNTGTGWYRGVDPTNIVIAHNVFHNEYGTAVGYSGGSNTVVEDNVIVGMGEKSSADSKAGMQVPGSGGIVRNNLLYSTGTDTSTALNFGMVLDGSQGSPSHNRWYNNTVYGVKNNSLFVTQRGENHIDDNKLVNNAFYNNDTKESSTYPFDWYFELFHDAADNTWPYFPNNNQFINNLMLDRNADGTDDPGKPNLIEYDKEGWTKSLAQVQTDYPNAFTGNIETNPRFVNPSGGDFHLQAGSPLIDAGVDLTHTTTNGNKTTTIHVEDATFFTDGMNLIPGDLITITSRSHREKTVTAQVISRDDAHTLTVDKPISYTHGDAVNLAYNGTAPDIGAYEYGS